MQEGGSPSLCEGNFPPSVYFTQRLLFFSEARIWDLLEKLLGFCACFKDDLILWL